MYHCKNSVYCRLNRTPLVYKGEGKTRICKLCGYEYTPPPIKHSAEDNQGVINRVFPGRTYRHWVQPKP